MWGTFFTLTQNSQLCIFLLAGLDFACETCLFFSKCNWTLTTAQMIAVFIRNACLKPHVRMMASMKYLCLVNVFDSPTTGWNYSSWVQECKVQLIFLSESHCQAVNNLFIIFRIALGQLLCSYSSLCLCKHLYSTTLQHRLPVHNAIKPQPTNPISSMESCCLIDILSILNQNF